MKVENAQRNTSMSEAEVVQLFCIPTNLEKIMFHLPDIIFFKSLAAWDYLYASTCCTQFGPKTLDASLVIWLFNRNNSCGHLHVPYTKNRRFGTNWFRVFFRTAQFFHINQRRCRSLSLDRRPVEKRLPKRCLFKRDGETTDAFWILMASNLHEWNTTADCQKRSSIYVRLSHDFKELLVWKSCNE